MPAACVGLDVPLRSANLSPTPDAAKMLLHKGILLTLLGGAALLRGGITNSPDGETSDWMDRERGITPVTAFDVPATRSNGEVWAFAKGDHGRLWVGSDELYLFDGQTREKVPLPYETFAVRGLVQDSTGRIWVGTTGAIGYLEPAAFGKWRYVSAEAMLRASGVKDLGTIWEAKATPRGVVFVADQQVLRWDGSRFEFWKLPCTPRLFPCNDRDTLWLHQAGTGLLRMDPDGPHLVFSSSELPPAGVTWAVSTGPAGGASSTEGLIVGANEGAYVRRAGQWVKLEQLSAALAGKSPWRAVRLTDNTLAIGTYLGGIVIGRADDQILALIDRNSGLPSDSICSLWLDDRDNLWAGCSEGMARIDTSGAVTEFSNRSGMNEIPALKVIARDNETYVLSRKALSRLTAAEPGRPAGLVPVTRPAQPWSDVMSTESGLWLSGVYNGLWRIVDGQEKQAIAGSDFIFAMLQGSPPFTLFYLQNTSVMALAPNPTGGWATHNLAGDFGAYPVSLVRDGGGDLWVSTVTHGIYRCRLAAQDGEPSRLRIIQHYDLNRNRREEDLGRPLLTVLGGRVFVFSEQNILELSPDEKEFVPSGWNDGFTGMAAAQTDDPNVAYWVVRKIGTTTPALMRIISGGASSPRKEALDVPDLQRAGRITTMSFTRDAHRGLLWIAGSKVLLRIAPSSLPAAPPPPAISLAHVWRNDREETLHAANESLTLDADTKRLRLDLAGIARSDGSGLFVQSQLVGFGDDWSKLQPENRFEYTGLQPGSYVFRARAMDRFGQAGPITQFAFVLNSPWYWSNSAIAAYLFAGALAIFAGVRWRLRHLRRQNERLNQLVDDRTREVAEMNASRNEFLESISHEIRNPLNGIANLVDLLRDSPLRPEERQLAKSLGRSAEHLKKVFEDVLAYTKLEYEHGNIAIETFSLESLLDDVVGMFGVRARKLGSTLHVTLPPEFVDGFRGDAEKIRTVVSNFVDNALKYAPNAAISIEASHFPQTSETTPCEVRIGVRDQGPGISPKEQAGFFKKFVRGEQAKAKGIGGTGLGLATCRGLAELMHGSIGVESAIGQGSTFWIKMPLERALLPVATAGAAKSDPRPVPRGDAWALIVDDQEYNQDVLRGIARRLGYEADVALNATEVWPLVERRNYDVVFLDWELPGLHGGEIARRLRAHAHTQDAVIVATTAHDSHDIRQRCLESGMNGFALKPFNTDQILAILTDASAYPANQIVRPGAIRTTTFAEPPPPAGLTLSAFADFAAGNPTLAHQATARYLTALGQELDALREAMDAGNAEAIARKAHRLRSHAGLVNATALNAAAHKLVDAANGQSPDSWRDRYQEILDEAEVLKRAIAALGKPPTTDA